MRGKPTIIVPGVFSRLRGRGLQHWLTHPALRRRAGFTQASRCDLPPERRPAAARAFAVARHPAEGGVGDAGGLDRGRCREQGFALLIALLSLALLGVIIIGLVATGRTDAKLAENLRSAAMAEAAADGATFQAIFRLMSNEWSSGPLPHVVHVGQAEITVSIEDTAHLVNPNNAPVPLLAALLRQVGTEPQSAQAIAAAIAAYRDQGGTDPAAAYSAAGLPYGPAHQDFRTVAELRWVVGMTPELYERLAPHLSVWKLPMVVPDAADPVVAAAYRDAGPNGGFGPRFPTLRWLRGQTVRLDVRIVATASVGGAQFGRLAEVQLRGAQAGIPSVAPYQIMAWGRPDD